MVAIPDELLKEASGTLKIARVYSSILVSDECCNKTFQLSTTFKDCFVVLGSIFYFGGYFFFKKNTQLLSFGFVVIHGFSVFHNEKSMFNFSLIVWQRHAM